MKKRRALVLDPDCSAGIETVQSLGRRGCIVDTATFHREDERGRSRYIRRQFDLTQAGEQAGRHLASLWEGYDLVVATTDVALRVMLGRDVPAEMYMQAVLPDREDLQRALDKEAVWTLARKLLINVPDSSLVSVNSRIPERFPVVLKPVFSKTTAGGEVRSHNVAIVRDEAEWRVALEMRFKGIPVQQQEYVCGKGVGVEMLFEKGKPRWAFVHERVHEVPLTGGGSSYRVSRPLRDDLVRSAESLLSALKWHGVAMVEYKERPSGECYVMEINPRLWGSLALSVRCGVDFPFGMLCLAEGVDPGPQPQYRVGYFARNVYRDIEWFKLNRKANHADPLLLTRPATKAVLEWFRPLAGKEAWDFFQWSDPVPIMGEWKRIVLEHLVKIWRKCGDRVHRIYLEHVEQPVTISRLKRRKATKLLFLCYGNICRSPLAAAIAAKRFPKLKVSSAGFYPMEDRPAPDFVLTAAQRMELNLDEHRSRRVDAKMIEEADIIAIMDIRNYKHLKSEFPTAMKKTVFLGMLHKASRLEIHDPYDHPESMPETAVEIAEGIEGMRELVK
jgi:protein-tyrosine-phosphatase/predicted ATP-grasp superfamily ATP-dependent carboligase